MHPTPLPLDLNNPYMQKIEDPKRVAFWKTQQAARVKNSEYLGGHFGTFGCGKDPTHGVQCMDKSKKPPREILDLYLAKDSNQNALLDIHV